MTGMKCNDQYISVVNLILKKSNIAYYGYQLILTLEYYG